MIDSFTIVPEGEFRRAAALVAQHAAADAGVLAMQAGRDAVFFFCGDELVRRALRVQVAAQSAPPPTIFEPELASLRVCEAAAVLHVDARGYEGSVEHLYQHLLWIFDKLAPCTVYDDETGADLTLSATRLPSSLLFSNDAPDSPRAEPADGAARVPISDLRDLRPVPSSGPPRAQSTLPPPPRSSARPPHPGDASLAGLVDVPMPGVRSRR